MLCCSPVYIIVLSLRLLCFKTTSHKSFGLFLLGLAFDTFCYILGLKLFYSFIKGWCSEEILLFLLCPLFTHTWFDFSCRAQSSLWSLNNFFMILEQVLLNQLFLIIYCAADCSRLPVMACTQPYWAVSYLRAPHLSINIALSTNPALRCTNGSLTSPPWEIPFYFLVSLLLRGEDPATDSWRNSFNALFCSGSESLLSALKNSPFVLFSFPPLIYEEVT